MQFEQVSSKNAQKYSAWKKASLSTNQADPFCCTPTWQLSFHDAFSPRRRLLIEESPGCTIALAEKRFSPENVYLTPIEPHWFFGCPLLGKSAPERFLDMMPFLAETYKTFFPKLLISGIRPKGVLAQRLIKLFGGNFTIFLHSTGCQCAASLAGGVDSYMSRRSSNHRSKLKKAIRRAFMEEISFERVVPVSGMDAGAVYARMLAVELTSWKGIGQCGMEEPPAKQFYEIMLQRLSDTGEARIIFAQHEGKDIGFIFGALAGRIYRGQQFSYNDEWKAFSLGNLMQLEQIKWLCEEGAVRYDMGPLNGPRMEYKKHWTEKEIEIQTWLFEKR